jgi:hypothetical protein
MDQSIFSLFTTKDWPFESARRASDVNETDNHAQKQKSRSRGEEDLLASKRLRSREQTIDGMLFFDRLMKLGSIPNFKDLFPPPHPSRLRQLLDSIDACAFDLLSQSDYLLLSSLAPRRAHSHEFYFYRKELLGLLPAKRIWGWS